MGCLESCTDSHIAQSQAESSFMLLKQIVSTYNVCIQPPSLSNGSLIRKMAMQDACPSEVFLDIDVDKYFHSETDSSQGSQKSEKRNRKSKSNIISIT